MNTTQAAALMIGIAFLSGSLPFGYWAGRWKGIDIRQHGSGNIGATNVIRVLGKEIGVPVFILDMLKGFLPTLCGQLWIKNLSGLDDTATMVGVFCAAAAVLGHTYTFWLNFKGGKGVATSAGGLLGLAPMALVLALVVWIIVMATTRYVALASIVAAMVLPISMAVVMTVEHKWNYVLLGLGMVLGVLVVVRHRGNIRRLLTGTENRFEPKRKRKGKGKAKTN